jgi:hypothetical protein
MFLLPSSLISVLSWAGLLGLASIGAMHVVSTVLDKLGKPNPISSPLAEVP